MAPRVAEHRSRQQPRTYAPVNRLPALAYRSLVGASLWVAQNRITLLEAQYGSYGPRTQVAIASASKWVSALVLARLVERGALRFDSTADEWWPDAPADRRGITVRRRFSHTSGLR